MQITTQQENGILIIRAEGKFTAPADRQLSEALRAGLDQGALKIVINFAKVTTMDSSGLGELVACFMAVKKVHGELALCGVNSRIFNLIRMTNLHTVFALKDTEAESLEALGATV